VPLIIFDVKGLPATRRERVEAAVAEGGKHIAGSYEGWISVDPFNDAVVVVITGPLGFERLVQFPLDAEAYEIIERVRATLEE
jgi:hypothetical protein